MYDGEDSFFPCCQKKYNILGREKSFPLVSSVVETSEKVSLFYFFCHFGGDFPLRAIFLEVLTSSALALVQKCL